jgi:hypothetical protein
MDFVFSADESRAMSFVRSATGIALSIRVIAVSMSPTKKCRRASSAASPAALRLSSAEPSTAYASSASRIASSVRP